MSINHHSFEYIGATCRSKISASVDFNNTNSATSRFIFNIQVFKFHVAKSRNMHPDSLCRFQNCSSFLHHNWFIINYQIYYFHRFCLIKGNCIEFTFFETDSTFDAKRLIDKMRHSSFTGYCANWTIAETQGTTCTQFFNNFVS